MEIGDIHGKVHFSCAFVMEHFYVIAQVCIALCCICLHPLCCIFALYIGLTGNEYLSTPLTPLMDKTTNVHVHAQPTVMRTPSTASTTSKGRLYTYLSGSDGDIDDIDTEDRVSSSGVSSNPKRHWRRGSGSSVSSNELDDSHLQNTAVSQLSLSASEAEIPMPLLCMHSGNVDCVLLLEITVCQSQQKLIDTNLINNTLWITPSS